MDGAQVGILEKSNQVRFWSLLQCHDCGWLEAKIGLEVLCDFSHQSLEWQFSDEKLGRFLVSSDLTKSNSSRPVSMGFLHSASGWGTLSGSLCCQLLSWSFSTSRFACSLLCSGHFQVGFVNLLFSKLEVFELRDSTFTATYLNLIDKYNTAFWLVTKSPTWLAEIEHQSSCPSWQRGKWNNSVNF